MSISRQLNRAIVAAEKKVTRYRIAKDSEISYDVLARFLDRDSDIKLSTVDSLAEYLDLELKPKSRRRK
jgi:DNA-binding phage protein